MELVPFEPRHLVAIAPQASQAFAPASDSPALRRAMARKLKAGGPCWTLLEKPGGRVLVVGGFINHRAHHASLWSVMAEMKRGGLVYVTQFLRAKMAERLAGLPVGRIDMTVDPRDRGAVRWAVLLGMKFEAGKQCYGAGGETMHEYVLVRRLADERMAA